MSIQGGQFFSCFGVGNTFRVAAERSNKIQGPPPAAQSLAAPLCLIRFSPCLCNGGVHKQIDTQSKLLNLDGCPWPIPLFGPTNPPTVIFQYYFAYVHFHCGFPGPFPPSPNLHSTAKQRFVSSNRFPLEPRWRIGQWS